MNTKKKLHTEVVTRIKGLTSRELTDRCPDLRPTFPVQPCTNRGCEFAIKQLEYMNCMFVASEAGEHTLEAVGEMMGITREGARLIERRALLKVRHSKQLQEYGTAIREPSLVAGPDIDSSIDEGPELADERYDIPGLSD